MKKVEVTGGRAWCGRHAANISCDGDDHDSVGAGGDQLAVVVLPGADDVLVLGLTKPREQLYIAVMVRLKNNALGKTKTMEVTDGGKKETLGPVNARRVALTTAATQRVADIDENEQG